MRGYLDEDEAELRELTDSAIGNRRGLRATPASL